MKTIFLLLLVVFINGLKSGSYEDVLTDLKNLEKYIRDYIQEKAPSYTLTHLITCYIRLGAYSGMAWDIAGGTIPDDLATYISFKDATYGTNAANCQNYGDIDLPTGEKLDFVHSFAVMNGIENGKSYEGNFAHLVGWGGDSFQLLKDIKNEQGTVEEIMEVAKTYFNIKGGFGPGDLIGDVDAPILLKKKTDDNDFADLIRDYYSSGEYLNRYNNFIAITFPTITDKDQFRDVLFSIYSSDTYIQILECQEGIRSSMFTCYLPGDIKPEYVNNQKAALYVVSDFFAEQYNPQSRQVKKTVKVEKKEEEKEPETEKKAEEIKDVNNSGFSFNLHLLSFISIFVFLF